MSKKTKTLEMFEDPGHAWCKVRRDDKIFQMIAKEVSNFSFQRGNCVYLEEDCDLGLYYNKLVELGYEIKWKYNHTDDTSRIRGYESYEYREIAPEMNTPKKERDIKQSSAIVYIISKNQYAISYCYSFRGISRCMKSLDKKFYSLRDKDSGIRTISKSIPLSKSEYWYVNDLDTETNNRLKNEIRAHVEKFFS